MADRAFAAFYYKGDRLLAVDAVNRPGEFLGAKALIHKGLTVSPEAIADMGRTMKEIVAAASQV
jgi:3-phenylpropionate/trans-cinnamate dioxygenase ferredoxin reductase subunit